MRTSDSVTVTTVVDVDPATAFDVFTREIDVWWKRAPRYRFDAERSGSMRFEAGVGGRLLEVHDEAAADVFEVGRILAWEPGARLVFEWRGRGFRPGECTEVEVRFEPAGGATRLTLEHRGWDRLPPDHPARFGFTGLAFADMIGLWWADLLVAMRRRSESSPLTR
jgi:uncharacterized protein YndB with AHSA1/START domain